MQKKVIKVLSLMMAILMLAAVFASCKKDGDDGSATTTAPVGDKTNLHQALGMEIRNYSGKSMNIWYSNTEGLRWCAYPMAVTVEESATDIIYKAGYQRNEEMKNRIGLDVVYKVNSGGPNSDEAVLEPLVKSGDIGNYDMVVTGIRVASALALKGYATDLSLSPHIKAGEYWYESSINKQITVKGKQYFAMGYYSWGNTAATETTFVNMGIVEDKTEVTKEELYAMALDKQFTFDKMLEIGKANAIPDTGSEPTNSQWQGRKRAYITSYNASSSLFYNLGGKVITIDNNNNYQVVVAEKKNQDIIKYAQDKVTNNQEAMLVERDEHDKAFMAGVAPFITMSYYSIEDVTASAIAEKVIFLPPPLYEEGNEYNAYVNGENITVAFIPAAKAAKSAESFDQSAYLFEFFMVASYEISYPAFYEKTFKTRYQPDATSRKVFDICQNAKTVCLANVYKLFGDTGIAKVIREGMSPATGTKKINGQVKKNLDALTF